MVKEVTGQLNFGASNFNVLADVIDTLRFRGSIFFHSDLAAPWGMSLSSVTTPRFHIALEGGFYVGTSDDQVAVNPMDIVMLPDGGMHWISDQVGRKLVPSEEAGDACELGKPMFQEGAITNRLMCGLVEYDDVISHPIVSAMPSLFHISNISEEDSIWLTVRQIDNEIIRSGSKKNNIIDRLTEVLFIQLLNQYFNQHQDMTGFLAALKEPRLATVLQLIHKHPEQLWSLERFSAEIGMSRSTLQRKFKSSLGVSPITYLSNWRMTKAHQLIRHTSLSLEDIAEAVGFSDARTFRAAFQRHYGFTPRAVRQDKR